MIDWLNVALWATQICLCALFLFAGVMKLTKTQRGLAEMGWAWAQSIPLWFTQLVGIMELLGAIGIVLPALTHIMTFLVPLAAIGFVVLQMSAIVLHAGRGETSKTLWLNLILLSTSLFVVWGCW